VYLIGRKLQLEATITPENATNKTVTWTSSNPEVATVDANGLVTAVANGTCTITATTTDGNFTATCNITVDVPTEPDPPAQPENMPAATVGKGKARAGEQVTLDVIISKAPNLGSLAASDISYDSNALELVSFEWKALNPILSNWDASKGKGAIAYQSPVDLNGVVITLTFKVKNDASDGDYSVSCKLVSSDCEFNNVAGQITVYSEIPGDLDGNEKVDKDDAIYLLMNTFFPEDYPVSQNADFDGNGKVDKDDAIHLLMYTFFPEDYPL